MSNQYLSFDVTKQSAPQQLITGRQGDSQLKFVTMLFWDGDKNVPYDLTGKQVAFEALKPDNTHIVDYEGITILDAEAGLVRYSFNEQVFSVAGTMQQAFFKINHTDSDNNVIADSTLEVTINILENRVEFGINSKDYLSEYDKLVSEVKKKFDDYAATVQDSINKAQALHDQIVQYTNLINSNGVILRSDFGDISKIRQPSGQTAIDKLNNEFNDRGVNVSWYGAKGDGITDDTAAIQSAFDSNPNGHIVFNSNKIYAISKPLQITTGLTIDGNMATLKLLNKSECLLNIFTSGLVFKNFWLEKPTDVQAFGMKIQGNANYFDNIHSRNGRWVSFIYGVAVKESHFSRIRVDNDPTNKEGTIFEFNYSINNTISDSFIGYAVNGILLNNVPAPINNDNPTAYYNEGLMIDNTTIVECNVAVNVMHGTSINISNSVLDFCGDFGVCLDMGQALMLTNTWIAVINAQGTSVGVYNYSTSAFREIIINGNELVGTPNEKQQKAFNLTNNNINVSINNNILQALNGGTAFSKYGSINNNVIPDGIPITGYPQFTTKTFYPTQQAANAFQVKSAIIELYASILGTNKTLKATGNVDVSGNINLNVDASNGIKLGSVDATSGTVSVYTDEGNYTNMQLVAKVYPFDHLSLSN
ncbi:BppU family phage baseplate upper protein [Leuconostoc citreum]|uniref:BppU family phage baseplate upper protein n=1 Tax=Leuconostoc citreum TaxID=33964 RepID=UPI0015F686E1|nr:BppU family phage baseplate upper protein [Leuconostoc citreum]MBA5938540.1 BppU family phage baseplate upper protein [Leuconostoc citreum]